MPISSQNLTNAQDEIIVESFKRKMTGSDLRENLKFSHQNDRMTKRCNDALNASRRRIYNIFYSKQCKVTQSQGESDRVFLQLLKKGLRQEIPLYD